MTWPPRVGEPLPNAAGAIGIRKKLLDYSLNPAHRHGGPKARGFRQILGITILHLDYVEGAIRTAILAERVQSVRHNPPHGINCVVEFLLEGVADKKTRTVNLRTTWELIEIGGPPRLISAYLRP